MRGYVRPSETGRAERVSIGCWVGLTTTAPDDPRCVDHSRRRKCGLVCMNEHREATLETHDGQPPSRAARGVGDERVQVSRAVGSQPLRGSICLGDCLFT
jgi:hypothetical protein